MNTRTDKIFKRINEHKKHVESLGYTVLVTFLQGSQNYGLDIYTDEYMSDIDTKSIVLPSLKSIVNSASPVSKVLIMDNDEHAEVKDIRVMAEMFRKQNISYLELLFTEFRIINPQYKDLVEQMLSMRDSIAEYHKNQLLRCISGMAKEKLKALEHPYPSIIDKIENYGYDPKQLSHLARLLDFLEQYRQNTPFSDCFYPINRQEILDLKTKPIPLEQARELAKKYDSEILGIRNELTTTEEVIIEETLDNLNDIKTRIIERTLRKELEPKPKNANSFSDKVFVISDLHIGHDERFENDGTGILALDNRPFENLENMKQEIIKRWNETVSSEDTVYILGDLSFESATKVNELLKSLNGYKHLIVGNHDQFINSKRFDKSLLESISLALEIEYKGYKVIMSHYPMAINDLNSRNYIHLHGHVHKRDPLFFTPRMYNVGCMMNDYKPIDLDSIINKQAY